MTDYGPDSLFGVSTVMETPPEWAQGSKVARQWWQFHLDHPEVYAELLDMTRQAHARGRHRIGVGMLFEVLRWNSLVGARPEDNEPFRLNNSHRAYYARLIVEREPALAGMFELRELHAA